jgi:glycerol-3-phosphate acyltransferase PlsY
MPLVYLVLVYLAAAVPFGLVLTTLYGGDVDVRAAGSGNIGATNVARTAGWRLGLVTLAGDVLKGAVPVAIAMAVQAGSAITAATGAAAFSGHVFPLTLRFAGGKGVATALGALALLWWSSPPPWPPRASSAWHR